MARPPSSKFIHYEQWQMDSLALGQLFLPAIQKMASRIPKLRCAVLCTPDGFNLCSLGLTEDQVELKKPGNNDAGASAEARRVEVSLG